jgi:hypothetical protein
MTNNGIDCCEKCTDLKARILKIFGRAVFEDTEERRPMGLKLGARLNETC